MPARRADLHDRKGKFATRVLAKADVPEKEARRLQDLTDDQGEEEVRKEHDKATKKAMDDAKKGDHLNAGLREYQREGVAWLAAQHVAGAGGGILGDDMGLGKTLQVLSFLQYLRDARDEGGPHLVVCPLSVLPTWVTEAKRWCPSLRAVAFHGPEAERNRLKQEVLLQGTFDVLVTTYEMLTAEQSMLAARFHFRYLILDEAQRVKNDSSLVSHAVRRIRTNAALLLTGTPLQNNLQELRALVSVLFQDVLEAAGAEKMEVDSDAAFGDDSAVRAARSLLQPLMLRRTKKAVLSKILPPKTETVVRIPLSDEQRRWYKTLLEGETGLFGKLATSNATSEKEALDNGRCIAEQGEHEADTGAVSNQQMTKLSNLLMQLRKVCCHPFLFGEDVAAKAIDHHDGNRIEALVACSGKLTALDEMLPRMRAGGHKVLIFSQFSMMLDVLEEFCDARGFAHLRLDGSTSLARRRYETALFNKKDGRHFVYLCSTRAGGLGINLQSADTVILADPDWNPTYDQQAMDRAHRLGQQRPVTVIRMCHASSVEEGILAVAARKRASRRRCSRDSRLARTSPRSTRRTPPLDRTPPPPRSSLSASSRRSSSPVRVPPSSFRRWIRRRRAPGAPARTRRLRARPPSRAPRRAPERRDTTTGKASTTRRRRRRRRRERLPTSGWRLSGASAAAPWRPWSTSTPGAGLGMQAVSRASILEAKEAEDRERRAAARATRLDSKPRIARLGTRRSAASAEARKSVSSRRRRSWRRKSPPSASTAVTAREPCLSGARGW